LIADFGLKATSFSIVSLQIDNDMQKMLLAKQEAQAYITSRKLTAESAFNVASETIRALKAQNIPLSPQQQNALVADLLFMICDPTRPQINFYQTL